MPRRHLLASCLAAALAVPCLAGAAPSLAPPLAMMPVQDQVMAPVVARFRADLASLERSGWHRSTRPGGRTRTGSTMPFSAATSPTGWTSSTSSAAASTPPPRCCPASMR